jgi:quercetin dioxygenase-like cupin family protein/DNA-binding XRE family transcriptional regulator
MTDDELLQLGLGQKLRRIREDRGLDTSQLAQRVEIPEEQLEAFEASSAVPGIGELTRIAAALDVSLGHFFQRAISERRVEVVRSRDRWTVQPQSEAARTLNYRYQALSYNLTDKLMAPFLVEIPPDASSELPSSTHDGEEFLFVLNGQLEVTVGGDVHRLSPGDSIYFDSRMEHTLRATEGSAVRIVACVAQERRPGLENPIDRSFSRH